MNGPVLLSVIAIVIIALIFCNNSSKSYFEQHPALAYQRRSSRGRVPAVYGDPIRPVMSTGPAPGKSINMPVPQGSLKLSSEKTGYPFYKMNKPLNPYDYFKPYGPNVESLQKEVVVSDTPFYKRGYSAGNGPQSSHGMKIPFGSPSPTATSGTVPFISSVNSYAPFPEVQTAWEKTGMLQTVNVNDESILNLYRRPIAPLQDLFEYSVQDKDGFIIPLKGVDYLEDGDIVKSVLGKESKGSWKANIFVENKWVWS